MDQKRHLTLKNGHGTFGGWVYTHAPVPRRHSTKSYFNSEADSSLKVIEEKSLKDDKIRLNSRL